MRVEEFDQLGEVGKRPRQPVDLIDDDHVDLAGPDILQQLLERRPLHRTSRKAAVVIAFPDKLPSLMGLAFDVGLRGLALVWEMWSHLTPTGPAKPVSATGRQRTADAILTSMIAMGTEPWSTNMRRPVRR